MSADDRLRDLLRRATSAPEPGPDHIEEARAALHAAYRTEPTARRRRSRHPSLVWASAAAAAAVVVAVLVLPGSTPSLDANLDNIARAARVLTAEEIPEGAYVYVRIESRPSLFVVRKDGPTLPYVLPKSIDIWVRETSRQERITVGRPIFTDAELEAAYYAGGYDEDDRVGETQEYALTNISNLEDISKLSTDPKALQAQVDAELSQDPDWSPDNEARTLQHLVELMHPQLNAPPALRAALLELIGALDVETQSLDNGRVRVSLEYEEAVGGRFLQELEFDREGYLRLDRMTVIEPGEGLPQLAGSIFSESSYERPVVVDGPGVLP